MTVFVTGATGFLGRRVVEAFHARGVEVRCLVHTPGKERVLPVEGVDVHYGRVSDSNALRAAIYSVDAVVHLVAIIREERNSTFEEVNHQGTQKVLEAAKEAGVKRFIQMSAIGAVEEPRYGYLRSKWLGEQAVIESGIPYTILRASLQFGEGDEFVNALAALVRAFPIVPVAGSGRNSFQPIAVEDTARCIVDAVEREDLIGETLEIGGPDQLTYNQIIDIVAKTLRVWRLRLHIPVILMRPMVRLIELVSSRPVVTTEQLRMLPVPNVTQPDSVQKVFGFKPKPLMDNIEYIKRISLWDGLRTVFGSMPAHIRPR